MPVRSRDQVAVHVAEAGDVVHLQADRMAEAVREENRRDAAFEHAARIHRHDAERLQRASQAQMALEMQLAIVETGAHLAGQRELLVLHRRDQVGEGRVAIAPGAGDVGGVTIDLGAGVDQQRAMLGRHRIALVLVVQRRAVLVQRDDVVVGHVVVGMAGGGEVGRVDAGFGGAGTEGIARRQMSAHRLALRATHQPEFVRGLVGAMVVQVVEQRLRIVRFEPGQGIVGFAQDRAPSAGGQVFRRLGRIGDHAHVEMFDPFATRRARRNMPVVVGLVIGKHGSAARRVGDPAMRVPRQRQPVLERRIGLERIRHVVEIAVLLDARSDQKVVVAAARERFVGARHHGRKMFAVGAHGGIPAWRGRYCAARGGAVARAEGASPRPGTCWPSSIR